MSIEEVERTNVEIFDIDEAGIIVIEKSIDYFILTSDEKVIDLNKHYLITETIISQPKPGIEVPEGQPLSEDQVIQIDLENENQLNYFKTILKELKNGNN